jgi:xanthine dehydrogenase large subunit
MDGGALGRRGAGAALRHDSALKHTTGEARYADDVPDAPGTLHAALVLSPVAHGRIEDRGLGPVRATPGVVAVLTAADIPGRNDVAAAGSNEPLFAEEIGEFAGPPLALVLAETRDAALRAAAAATPRIAPRPAILGIAAGLDAQQYVVPPQTMRRGDPEAALARAPRRIEAEFSAGGQEHFYLEGQVALALPQEGGDMVVHSSTQHPTEVQHKVAHAISTKYTYLFLCGFTKNFLNFFQTKNHLH